MSVTNERSDNENGDYGGGGSVTDDDQDGDKDGDNGKDHGGGADDGVRWLW